MRVWPADEPTDSAPLAYGKGCAAIARGFEQGIEGTVQEGEQQYGGSLTRKATYLPDQPSG